MASPRTSEARRRAIAHGYRSGLEETVDLSLKRRGVDGDYEGEKIEYVKPSSMHRYTRDFRLPNGIIVETKGRFTADDRQKHLLIKAQHPHLDIRFVFTNSRSRISKKSETTYAAWCRKHGFVFADKDVPDAWLKEIGSCPPL